MSDQTITCLVLAAVVVVFIAFGESRARLLVLLLLPPDWGFPAMLWLRRNRYL